MAYLITPDSATDSVVEIGVATSNENGYGTVIFTLSHYSNVYIVLSPEDDSSNCYLISKTSAGFSFGTSSPFKKISYKAISVSS